MMERLIRKLKRYMKNRWHSGSFRAHTIFKHRQLHGFARAWPGCEGFCRLQAGTDMKHNRFEIVNMGKSGTYRYLANMLFLTLSIIVKQQRTWVLELCMWKWLKRYCKESCLRNQSTQDTFLLILWGALYRLIYTGQGWRSTSPTDAGAKIPEAIIGEMSQYWVQHGISHYIQVAKKLCFDWSWTCFKVPCVHQGIF